METDGLKVAFVVGGLTPGGAEKQFLYMAKALVNAGARVRVYCLTQGDPYEKDLIAAGIEPVWIGERPQPWARMLRLIGLLRKDRPHIVQSSHFFTNLYAAVSAQAVHAISIGSVRSDPQREVRANGFWGRWLLRLPSVLLANSETAREKAIHMGVPRQSVFSLPNVIDLSAYPFRRTPSASSIDPGFVTAVVVARLVAVKRLDRFLQGLAIAREKNPRIRGVIVGDGPEKQNYQALAEHLGLTPDGVSFAGLQLDVPNWLNRADIFCLTSDQEGFPNVILEAMAAGLPVITTPAGDADTVVQEGITGTIIAMDDGQDLAGRLVQLASDPDLRTRMGAAGRHRVETVYSYESLASRLIQAYQKMALLRNNQPVLRALHPFKEIGMAPDQY